MAPGGPAGSIPTSPATTSSLPLKPEQLHRTVWCSVATVDTANRPRSRILHPLWEWDGESLVGWIATVPTALKQRHLIHSPYVSCSYWSPAHDTCTAECLAAWRYEDESCQRVCPGAALRGRGGEVLDWRA